MLHCLQSRLGVVPLVPVHIFLLTQVEPAGAHSNLKPTPPFGTMTSHNSVFPVDHI